LGGAWRGGAGGGPPLLAEGVTDGPSSSSGAGAAMAIAGRSAALPTNARTPTEIHTRIGDDIR